MAGIDDLEAALRDGEALRFHGDLRRGECVGLTDRRLLVITDEQSTSVPFEGVEEVTFQRFDWFVAVLSVVLVGFGVYSLGRDPLIGGGFALAGLASVYITYRKRDEVLVQFGSRAKPLRLYPVNLQPFREAFERGLQHRQAELDASVEPTA